MSSYDVSAVAPFVGAWIEIQVLFRMRLVHFLQSLRSSERGLKFKCLCRLMMLAQVAPFVGAWIEMIIMSCILMCVDVAPFVGAWIEILISNVGCVFINSRSVRRSVD